MYSRDANFSDSDEESLIIDEDFSVEGLYRKYGSSEIMQLRSIFGRDFLVSTEMKGLQWSLSDEERTYLGYGVIKATTISDDISVVAWYAPDISFPAGSDHFGGLPGVILSLDVSSESFTYSYMDTTIELNSTVQVEQPHYDEQLTLSEFRDLAGHKLDEEWEMIKARGAYTERRASENNQQD